MKIRFFGNRLYCWFVTVNRAMQIILDPNRVGGIIMHSFMRLHEIVLVAVGIWIKATRPGQEKKVMQMTKSFSIVSVTYTVCDSGSSFDLRVFSASRASTMPHCVSLLSQLSLARCYVYRANSHLFVLALSFLWFHVISPLNTIGLFRFSLQLFSARG